MAVSAVALTTDIPEAPSVSLSYANNFWGKEDAGVAPLLGRMLYAKTTCDELKAFYSVRASLEDEYGRKLLALARKPLGMVEQGTLRASLEIVRSEVEQMGKAHQGFALKMRSDLEDPLGAFAGSMKERRKIVQTGIEKLLKTKTHQTVVVNKARDRYEQECLKIKGYLAQGHMVMGQEERKNKAKLEKTQIQLSATNAEYEAAIKMLEETTVRWNREWKAACDKFQDLDEERINFMKTSLWAFANMTSTVCVSDDGSCEKMRLSLEECDVEEDIAHFISECGTGQEIPDPPRFIDFCRGDVNDGASEASASDEFVASGGGGSGNGGGGAGGYSVAQFSRTANPAYQTSTAPQQNALPSPGPNQGQLQAHLPGPNQPGNATALQKSSHAPAPLFQPQPQRLAPRRPTSMAQPNGPNTSVRPPSRDSLGEERDARDPQNHHPPYSMQNQQFSQSQPFLRYQPNEPEPVNNGPPLQQKSRSSFFSSPFRRNREDSNGAGPNANLGSSSMGNSTTSLAGSMPANPARTNKPPNAAPSVHTQDPEALPNTQKTQIAVGGNVFDIDSGALMRQQQNSQGRNQSSRQQPQPDPDYDPIAAALAELQVAGGGGVSPTRDRRDRPNPPGGANPGPGGLGVPEPAFTSRQMRMTKQRFVEQTGNVFGGNSGPGTGNGLPNRVPVGGRPASSAGGHGAHSIGRSGRSPSPGGYGGYHGQQPQAHPPQSFHSQAQPPQSRHGHSQSLYHNPLGNMSQPALNSNASSAGRPRAQSSSPVKARHDYDANSWGSRTSGYPINSGSIGRSDGGITSNALVRSRPTSPMVGGSVVSRDGRGPSPGGNGYYGRHSRSPVSHQTSQYAPSSSHGRAPTSGRPVSRAAGSGPSTNGVPSPSDEMALALTPGPRARAYSHSQSGPSHQQSSRPTSGSQPRYTSSGRPVLHHSRALYSYTAVIAQEMSFFKNDILAVLMKQDDGWWEAEIVQSDESTGAGTGVGESGVGAIGLVPSNYLQNI